MIKDPNKLEAGISVIVPSLSGSESLNVTLESLERQNLDHDEFEVIVVINGKGALDFDSAELREQFPSLNLRIFRISQAGAGSARNIGLVMANREYITFVDDDDTVEPEFLRVGLEIARPDCVPLLPMVNRCGENYDYNNSINVRVQALAGKTVPVAQAAWALGFNACKIVYAPLARRFRYSEKLQSGEDLVYFANLLKIKGLSFVVSSEFSSASYVRTLRPDSVSRQSNNFDFMVRQRMDCISELRQVDLSGEELNARQSLERSQFRFIETHVRENQMVIGDAIEYAYAKGLGDLPLATLRREPTNRAVFAYCFPPYSDPSANVTAKLIRSEGQLVDVFYSDMSPVREKDPSTLRIVAPYVAFSKEIHVPPSFADWGLISEYALAAVREATHQVEKNGRYETMYSRALWSGSHVAAALFKMKFPEVEWEAEFSDPLRQGIDGGTRKGRLLPNTVSKSLAGAIESSTGEEKQFMSHFELTELATIVLADKLVFTNENQRTVMLEGLDQNLQRMALAKSKIRPHVVPPAKMYNWEESTLCAIEGAVNIGYFGSFYANRGIGEVVSALAELPAAKQRKIALHIFTQNPEELRSRLQHETAGCSIYCNEYVPYLEFLNLATKFDVLVVCDVTTKGSNFLINPFLPSKYSDYVGSGSLVWGIVEPGSTLSGLRLDYKSFTGEVYSSIRVLSEIANLYEE